MKNESEEFEVSIGATISSTELQQLEGIFLNLLYNILDEKRSTDFGEIQSRFWYQNPSIPSLSTVFYPNLDIEFELP